ncbi:unnamed protein product [Cylindrotheca closterium]|uniref:Choline/carnitine acyltransferase domain-containing protein n=1 Tax=Cylindrotheca closterium TaxID=2856 RepID=A0AAD2CFI8_9STRA|nr:unnamed protein product [Cylindrotheca closterium]
MVAEVTEQLRVLDTQISALSDLESNTNLQSSMVPDAEGTTDTSCKSTKTSITYGAQSGLPPLPIPSLEETLNKFIRHLEPLQSKDDHERSKQTVMDFLQKDGPRLQKLLVDYDKRKRASGEIGSYVEEFWNESYLAPDSSVVLNLNPFFVLEDSPDPKIAKDPIRRASVLCFVAIKMVSQLRFETLKPDQFRGKALCMDQFRALFATARIPAKQITDTIQTWPDSRHVAVLCCSQIYIFEALWEDGHLAVDEGDIVDILGAIQADAKEADPYQTSKSAIGLLTSMGRNQWADARDKIRKTSKRNEEALELIDSALFVLVLDDYIPKNKHDAAANMLHGSYDLQKRAMDNTNDLTINYNDTEQFQAGSCSNRWYDKMQIIVCGDGTAGINFEHSAVDGHTALRFVSDMYAETVVQFARSITKQIHSSDTVPHVVQAKVQRAMSTLNAAGKPSLDVAPKKIGFDLGDATTREIFYAETALGDEILACDIRVLEFKDFGKEFIVSNKMSPDSFVQLSMMLAYYRLYGQLVCTYEPVLTKTFYHGRTEAMRSATMEAKNCCEIFCNTSSSCEEKAGAMRLATQVHSQLVKECARGKGVDRHLFALKCIAERRRETIPFFESEAWKVLGYTILSTSNCGNPSLRLFGFGPVVPDGFGVGYIIKDRSIYYSISSKHRQTSRYARTLEVTLRDMAATLQSQSQSTSLSSPTRRLMRGHRANGTFAIVRAVGSPSNDDNEGGATTTIGEMQTLRSSSATLRDNWGELTPRSSPKASRQDHVAQIDASAAPSLPTM